MTAHQQWWSSQIGKPPKSPRDIAASTWWIDFTDTSSMSTSFTDTTGPRPTDGEGPWWYISKDSGQHRGTPDYPNRGFATQDLSAPYGVYHAALFNGSTVGGVSSAVSAVNGVAKERQSGNSFTENSNYDQQIFEDWNASPPTSILSGTYMWAGRVNAARTQQTTGTTNLAEPNDQVMGGGSAATLQLQVYADGADMVYQIPFVETATGVPNNQTVSYITFRTLATSTNILTVRWDSSMNTAWVRINGGAWQTYTFTANSVLPGGVNMTIGATGTGNSTFQMDLAHTVSLIGATNDDDLGQIEGMIAKQLGITLG